MEWSSVIIIAAIRLASCFGKGQVGNGIGRTPLTLVDLSSTEYSVDDYEQFLPHSNDTSNGIYLILVLHTHSIYTS